VASDIPAAAASLAAAAAGAVTGASKEPERPKKQGSKGTHALRTLFNVAHRLADSLGQSWIHVVQVLNTLEAVLAAGKVGRLLLGAVTTAAARGCACRDGMMGRREGHSVCCWLVGTCAVH
jgi:hypothetical protein